MAFQLGEKCPSLPENVFRATVYKLHNHWICSGFQEQIPRHSPHITTILDRIQFLPPSIRWSIAEFWATDNGEHIAQAIIKGNAIALSDGSFKNQRGASAWVIEGDNEIGRIKGWNMVPGSNEDQSAYRSELTGLLALLVMTGEICKHHDIMEGSITIGCDGLSALEQTSGEEDIIPLRASDYDILWVIRKRLQTLPIHVNFRHVRGHQDNKKPVDCLDRWERLNVEMDALAKHALIHFSNHPTHNLIEGEPWSVWYGDT